MGAFLFFPSDGRFFASVEPILKQPVVGNADKKAWLPRSVFAPLSERLCGWSINGNTRTFHKSRMRSAPSLTWRSVNLGYPDNTDE